MAKLVLIRGVPGSGKSTIARIKYPDYVLCEADQYFDGQNGYQYNHKKIKEAHEYCYNKARKALAMGLDVVVANTFIRRREVIKYLELPFSRVVIMAAKGNYQNIHGVPPETVARMKKHFEQFEINTFTIFC